MMFATLLLTVACLTDSPSATITIQTSTHVERGTVLAPCSLIIEGNYERLVKLMGRPDDEQVSVVEIPPIPMAK